MRLVGRRWVGDGRGGLTSEGFGRRRGWRRRNGSRRAALLPLPIHDDWFRHRRLGDFRGRRPSLLLGVPPEALPLRSHEEGYPVAIPGKLGGEFCGGRREGLVACWGKGRRRGLEGVDGGGPVGEAGAG